MFVKANMLHVIFAFCVRIMCMVNNMNIKKYHTIAFFFILFCGTLLHFTYDFFNHNTFVSYFSAVNESPWEHLKLLFFPSVVFWVFEYFSYGKSRPDFWAVKMTSTVSAMAFILIFFYTYSGILGFYLLFFDILDFILADLLCCIISYKFLSSPAVGDKSDSVKAIFVMILITLCFVIWTNNPPDLGVFWG